MDKLNVGQFLIASIWDLLIACPLLLAYLFSKKMLSRSRFLRFLGILLIGSASSMIPLGLFGLFMGFPSVLICSIFVSIFLDKEKNQ